MLHYVKHHVLHHPGTEGTFVTWDFGRQCLRWVKSGHPGIFRSCTLHFLYVGQLGKSVAVLDIYPTAATIKVYLKPIPHPTPSPWPAAARPLLLQLERSQLHSNSKAPP